MADEQARRPLSRRDRSDFVHGVELSRLRHRQRGQPRRRVPAQFPPGLCVGQGTGPAGRHLLSARPLRHLLRQLQGDAHLPDALGRVARAGEEDSRQTRPPGRRQAADPRRGRALFGMAARDARPYQAAPGRGRQRYPRHHPSGLPRLQDGARGRDLRRHGDGRQSRRRLHRPDADPRRAGDRLLHLVRLLRLRLPPYHR